MLQGKFEIIDHSWECKGKPPIQYYLVSDGNFYLLYIEKGDLVSAHVW